MKKFKLLGNEELLSMSLNNSNILNNNETDKENAAARGLAIISVSKKNKIFQKDVFDNALKNVNENKKNKALRAKSKKTNLKANITNKSLSTSISDLIIPKKPSKTEQRVLPIVKPFVLDPVSKDNNSLDAQPPTNIIVSNNASSESAFKTPKLILRNYANLESPMFTSSPIVITKSVNQVNNLKCLNPEVNPVTNNSAKPSILNDLPSPIHKETKTVGFTSPTPKTKTPAKEIENQRQSLKSEDSRVDRKRKSSSIIESDKNISNKAVKEKKRKNKNKVLSKRNVSKEYIPSKSKEVNKSSETEVRKTRSSVNSTKEKENSASVISSGSNFRTPQTSGRSLRSQNSVISASTPVTMIRGDKKSDAKSKKLSLGSLKISPIKKGTKSLSHQQHDSPKPRQTRSHTAADRSQS